MNHAHLFLLSVREWLRQYIQRDGIYFSFSHIWKLYKNPVNFIADSSYLEREGTTFNPYKGDPK